MLRYRRSLILAILVVVTVAVYWQVGAHDFVGYDDDTYVAENPVVKRGLTADGIAWAFTTTHVSNWHPLTWISHMLDVELFGVAPGRHHLVNVFLHALNAALLFLVISGMTGAPWRSGFVAALFALHPLHVESVAWVAERKDLLSAFFWMLAMGAYVRYAERPGPARYWPVALFFVLGLLSKPMLVTLPFVLLLLDVWPLRRLAWAAPSPDPPPARFPAVSPRRLLAEKLPLFALSAVSSVVTYLAQQAGGSLNTLEHYPLQVRAANAVVAYVGYLGKTVWPARLAVFYPHPGADRPLWVPVGALLGLSALTALALRESRRRPYLGVGWLWYLGTLVPVIGLVQVGAQAMADRYTYVPLIGVFIAIAWGAADAVSVWPRRRYVLGASGTVVLVAALLATWLQAGWWRNTTTLFQRAIDVTSKNWIAHGNMGVALERQGRLDEAVAHYREALRIAPGSPYLLNNMGYALSRQWKIGEAIACYREALRLKPDYAHARRNLGKALEESGLIDDAIATYREALRINPDDGVIHYRLALDLERKGRRDDAAAHYREALRIRPGNAAVIERLQKLGY